MDLDQAVQLCRSARRDLRGLMAALDRKSFYDIGHDIGHAAALGIAFKDMDKELVWLEQLITVGNLEAMRKQSWMVCDLVNYYDRLIDMIRSKAIPAGKAPPVADSIYLWRENAGKLAQAVCQLEDDEAP